MPPRRRRYISVRRKFVICSLVSLAWAVFCLHLVGRWIADLSYYTGAAGAVLIIGMIAIVPGFIYMFITVSLLFDRRPGAMPLSSCPPVTVLVPAYNEEGRIGETLRSITQQDYAGEIEIIVIDDGSTDRTAGVVRSFEGVRVIEGAHAGKSEALNEGLGAAAHELIVTIDADTCLRRNALTNMVERFCADPPHTAAVAGSVLVRNSRQNIFTRMQEWDYFLGIGSTKRMQSLFQGTLVAQGAFSLYRRDVLRQIGGWKKTIGEDIVLTWELLCRGYRTGFAENAIAFTVVPDTYRLLFGQRKRWAAGMIEGFLHNPRMPLLPRFHTLFILWNLLFPVMDSVYLFVFIPGIVLALFGHYYIAGPVTLLVVPMTLLVNWVMFVIGRGTFGDQGLRVRKNFRGYILYVMVYQFLLSPASVAGYVAGISNLNKSWGTK